MQCVGRSRFEFLPDGSVKYAAVALRHVRNEMQSDQAADEQKTTDEQMAADNQDKGGADAVEIEQQEREKGQAEAQQQLMDQQQLDIRLQLQHQLATCSALDKVCVTTMLCYLHEITYTTACIAA